MSRGHSSQPVQQESSPEQNKFRVLSHLTSEESDTDTETPATGNPEQKKRASLKQCPCRSSSGGKAWLLICTSCSQTWHNTCANLKGKLPKTTIDQIDGWQCPWCFVCPFAAPKNHRSSKNASVLNDTVIFDAINTTLEDTLNNSLRQQSDELLSTIQKDLDGLKTSLNEFATGLQKQNEQLRQCQHQGQENNVAPVIESLIEEMTKPNITPFSTYNENFVSEEQAASLIEFLEQEQFTKEGSREVKSYGERYHYKGSKSSETPIPDEIVPIIELIKEKNNVPYELNQVLVNKYKDSSSFLPAHSDNEGSIRPESNIFTLSLGTSGAIKFTDNNENTELKVDLNRVCVPYKWS